MSEAEMIAADESRDWTDRIRATAELEHKRIERKVKNRERQKAVSQDKRKQYRDTYLQNEMTEIFESFEWPIFELLQQVDSKLAQISKEASACQIPNAYRERFVREKLTDMIDQIAEQREGKRNAL